MNIFEYIGSLGDGGAETLVKDYALLLKQAGHDVSIITKFPNKEETANGKILKKNDVPIISIYNKRSLFLRILSRLLKGKIDSGRLKRIIIDKNPSVIHIHLRHIHTFLPLSNFLSERNIKLFYTCHSLPERYLGHKVINEYNAAKYLLKHNNLQIIALHQEMKVEIDNLMGINNSIVIRNGVDFENFRPLSYETINNIKKDLGFQENDYIVGHVGRFAPMKNHSFLICIFSEVLKRKPNAKLLLIGVGPLKNDIKKQVKEMGLESKVVFLHHRDDVNNLLRVMNVFVFPSFFEGLSMVLIEAQASGLKCVISDTINSASIASSKTITANLKSSPSEWADIIVNDNLENVTYNNLDLYNLRKIIKEVEKLYYGESSN